MASQKLISEVLDEQDDFELIEQLFTRIGGYGDDIELSRENEQEQVVTLVWQVTPLIGNGGFRYLFEGKILDDPDYSKSIAAFEAIGCTRGAAAIRRAISLFPEGRLPADSKDRDRLYGKVPEDQRQAVDHMFMAVYEEITPQLAAYIRRNRAAFQHL